MSECYKDPRVTVFIGDGFKFLPEHKASYDVIITDSSDPVGPAEALFKPDYFQLLKQSLKQGGNISTQAESLWIHLPLIKELKETCKKTFAVAEYGFTTIPTCEFTISETGVQKLTRQTLPGKSESWSAPPLPDETCERLSALYPRPDTTMPTSTVEPSWLSRSLPAP
jgi:spermidine synthase